MPTIYIITETVYKNKDIFVFFAMIEIQLGLQDSSHCNHKEIL